MNFKNLKSVSTITGFLCLCVLCAGLFHSARYMGWLAQDSGLPGTIARTVYGPDVRQEITRLKHVKMVTPDIPPVTVLCYHEVTPERENDCMNVKPEVLRRHIREFKKAGYTFVSIDDLLQHSANSTLLPKKAVLITFDDGYADNYNYAYPVLREEQVPAAFFVVSSTIGRNNRMTENELREMQANGMKIGSHTVNHENLTTMSGTEIDYEMRESKKSLEKILGKPVRALAYPAGKVNHTVLDRVKKYYDIAFLASVTEQKQTMYTLQRYGVFCWNEHIESIFRNR